MMYGYDFGAGWMWFVGIVLLLVLLALTALIIIVSVGGPSRGRPAMPSGSAGSARQIAEARETRWPGATSAQRPPTTASGCVRRGGHHYPTSITQKRPGPTRYNRRIRTVRFPVNTREHEGSQDIR